MRVLALLSTLALAACVARDEGLPPGVETFEGTIVYVALEGGFYGIETARGERLLPTNLPEAFHEDGRTVRVMGRYVEGVATAQTWGRPFEVAMVEPRRP